ncbi:hypothetical protein [Archangium violaceum]|uniref:hypothetical protein n=1 Tax=Archangium violaceum TaxID=83451 RepID=UPI0037C0ED6E
MDGAGPADFQSHEVYLRTAVSVEPNGWARYDYVRLPEYRWGIFLSQPERNRTIGFGDMRGQPVWQEPPEEHSAALRWLIATQGDAEPASVEQQRLLGRTCPSLYDLRNLLQVNVEEARHLWGMVYLLLRHFGAEGRNNAEELLARSSGSQEQPRILDAFNAPVEDWLHFFMYTTFTDRVGKMQLLAAAESAFDPLSRTAHFMAIEEAHHLFVGETGVARVLRRTAELMRHSPNGSARELGGIELSVIHEVPQPLVLADVGLFRLGAVRRSRSRPPCWKLPPARSRSERRQRARPVSARRDRSGSGRRSKGSCCRSTRGRCWERGIWRASSLTCARRSTSAPFWRRTPRSAASRPTIR